MLSGKDARPALALEALAALGLAGTVFRPLPVGEEEEEEVVVGWVPLGVSGVRLANLLLWGREEVEAEGEERWPVGLLREEDADERRFGPDDADMSEEADAEGARAGAEGGVLWGLTAAEGYRRPRRDHRLLFLAAVLLGWAGATWPDPGAGKRARGKRVPAVQAIVRGALKLRARDAEEVALLHVLLPRFRALAAGAGGAGEGVQR